MTELDNIEGYEDVWGCVEDEEDAECTCHERKCKRKPCKGNCGCQSCKLAYIDFMSCE